MVTPEPRRLSLLSRTLHLRYLSQGEGRPFLLLHGGAGPSSMGALAQALARRARAVLPTHPGFDGELRPDGFTRISDLVLTYLVLLDELALEDVVVVGNSVGGWIAAEMALRKSPRIQGAVLLNAVGIDTGSPEVTIADPAKLTLPELIARTFHDSRHFQAPQGAEAAAALANNQRALRVYAGEPFMHDPELRVRLSSMSTPTLVLWGASDQITSLAYGRRFAEAIPGARFESLAEAGHLPQVERTEEVCARLLQFAADLSIVPRAAP